MYCKIQTNRDKLALLSDMLRVLDLRCRPDYVQFHVEQLERSGVKRRTQWIGQRSAVKDRASFLRNPSFAVDLLSCREDHSG